MSRPNPQSIFNALLYGGASALLVMDVLFLAQALIQGNYVPVLPIVVGILLAGGLLFVVYAEKQARELDRKEHRRLSRVAHQLEQPLHALQEDMEQLVKRARKLPAEERLKLKRMETKTKTLLENVRDVFLMLRAQEGSVAQEMRTYDLCVLVRQAIERVQPVASAQNVEIVHKAHCRDAPVRVDRHLFFIALIHLLENAIFYSLKPGLVNVAVIKGTSTVRLVIQDRGIGIKGRDVGSIFLPFARGDKADQFDPDGIGVGLTLSRLIVREFSGSLMWRARQHNTGSEFEIRLPLARASS